MGIRKTNYSTEKYWRQSSTVSSDAEYLFDVYIDLEGTCASVFRLPEGNYRSIFYDGASDYCFEKAVDSESIQELTDLLTFGGETA